MRVPLEHPGSGNSIYICRTDFSSAGCLSWSLSLCWKKREVDMRYDMIGMESSSPIRAFPYD